MRGFQRLIWWLLGLLYLGGSTHFRRRDLMGKSGFWKKIRRHANLVPTPFLWLCSVCHGCSLLLHYTSGSHHTLRTNRTKDPGLKTMKPWATEIFPLKLLMLGGSMQLYRVWCIPLELHTKWREVPKWLTSCCFLTSPIWFSEGESPDCFEDEGRGWIYLPLHTQRTLHMLLINLDIMYMSYVFSSLVLP